MTRKRPKPRIWTVGLVKELLPEIQVQIGKQVLKAVLYGRDKPDAMIWINGLNLELVRPWADVVWCLNKNIPIEI